MTDTGLQIAPGLSIPRSELIFRFARSGGKGGQNVNKVETKVELLFNVRQSPSLSDDQKGRILSSLSSRIDAEGYLRIVAQESRSQWKNREDAVQRFVELLAKALAPRKKRRKSRIPAASKQKRLDAKRRRGDLKRLRRSQE